MIDLFHDRFIPPELSRLKLLSLNNKFSFHMISNSGHAPHNENPVDYRKKMIEILK